MKHDICFLKLWHSTWDYKEKGEAITDNNQEMTFKMYQNFKALNGHAIVTIISRDSFNSKQVYTYCNEISMPGLSFESLFKEPFNPNIYLYILQTDLHKLIISLN